MDSAVRRREDEMKIYEPDDGQKYRSNIAPKPPREWGRLVKEVSERYSPNNIFLAKISDENIDIGRISHEISLDGICMGVTRHYSVNIGSLSTNQVSNFIVKNHLMNIACSK
mmetsp:Transcript_15563/g.33712  ORF Transcript_15563/g.33712 Transcript_15563/m.33712 type:complete len:112 (+) Transcript_15563:153-488(+)